MPPSASGSPLRQLIKRELHRFGFYRRHLGQNPADGVAVLCFHGIRSHDEVAPFGELHVTRETFTGVCRTIATHCSPVSLDDLRAARTGIRRLPPNAVLVTFDDGYASVLEHGLPVLERFSIPAALFVCPEPIRRGRHFWFDALAARAGEGAVADARGLDYAAWRAMAARGEARAFASETHRPLTVAELRRLAESPLIEIGAHTLSHPVLANASPDQQRLEITGSRQLLSDLLGVPVRAFAYPFGEPGHDFGAEAIAAVSDAGFDLGCSTVPSFAHGSAEALSLPRYVMLDTANGPEFAHRMAYSWRPLDRRAHGECVSTAEDRFSQAQELES